MKQIVRQFQRLRIPPSLLASLLVQGLSIIVPFALIPFYARTLGVTGLGNLAIAQAASLVIGGAVDFGFHISGTREIARNRGRPEAIEGILADVHSAKLAMALLVTGLTFAALFLLPMQGNTALVAWSAAYGLLQGFSLTWFFGGLQRQVLGVSLDLAAKLTAMPLVLLLVRHPDDAWKVQAWFTVAQAAWIAVGLTVILRGHRFLAPSWHRARNMLIAGRHIFFQHVVGMSYNASTSVLLGLLGSSQAVGLFAGAERIARIPLMPVAPYRQIFFPVMAERTTAGPAEAALLWRWLFLLAMSVMTVCSAALFLFAGPIVRLALGPAFSGTVPLLRILAFLPVIAGAGELVGTYWLLAHKRDRTVSNCLAASIVAHILLMAVLCPVLGARGAAISVVVSQGLFLILAIIASLRTIR